MEILVADMFSKKNGAGGHFWLLVLDIGGLRFFESAGMIVLKGRRWV